MRPSISIVMPVHDTGRLLLDSVRSVVAQTLFVDAPPDDWELLIVDDASRDPETLAALDEARRLSSGVKVLLNTRGRGAAGARNTGVFAARGTWIGFLDSDDLWYPDFLRAQREAFAARPDVRWRAAHFDVGDDAARTTPRPLRERSPCLYRHVEPDYVVGRISVLDRAVDVLLDCGCMQVMTVQIDRELIRSVGGFDETFVCAEDYDLWLRLANVEPLAIAPLDAGIYRLRSGSLTKSGRPMYYGEDRMLLGLKADPAFAASLPRIDARLGRVYDAYCHHFRAHRQFAQAARFAARLLRLRPTSPAAWKHVAATFLRR